MKNVNITEFRKHLPAYLKRVQAGEELHVTSRGENIARVLPEENPGAAALARLAKLRGTMIIGDIEGPFNDVEWTSDEDNL